MGARGEGVEEELKFEEGLPGADLAGGEPGVRGGDASLGGDGRHPLLQLRWGGRRGDHL